MLLTIFLATVAFFAVLVLGLTHDLLELGRVLRALEERVKVLEAMGAKGPTRR